MSRKLFLSNLHDQLINIVNNLKDLPENKRAENLINQMLNLKDLSWIEQKVIKNLFKKLENREIIKKTRSGYIVIKDNLRDIKKEDLKKTLDTLNKWHVFKITSIVFALFGIIIS